MRRLYQALMVLVVAGAVGLVLTRPASFDPSEISGLIADPRVGEQVFRAAGCASCHAAPKSEGDARLVLAGGQAFASDFGTFYAPNISPDPVAGIGGWQAIDLVNALRFGTSPDGEHYYPAFPYASFAHITLQDMVSLFAYLQSLPVDPTPSRSHNVGFPFNIRASLGGWKMLFMTNGWFLTDPENETVERGRYLVEALGHCTECHTTRNALGGLKMSRWLGGAPNPTGKGTVPNITPAKMDWSDADLIYYFKTGFTPEFDTAGGLMAEVVENLATLPDTDLAAIVAYLRAIPAVR